LRYLPAPDRHGIAGLLLSASPSTEDPAGGFAGPGGSAQCGLLLALRHHGSVLLVHLAVDLVQLCALLGAETAASRDALEVLEGLQLCPAALLGQPRVLERRTEVPDRLCAIYADTGSIQGPEFFVGPLSVLGRFRIDQPKALPDLFDSSTYRIYYFTHKLSSILVIL
jgi:hypothetical protein